MKHLTSQFILLHTEEIFEVQPIILKGDLHPEAHLPGLALPLLPCWPYTASFFMGIFKQCNTILWKVHNNKRQDQKESFTIIIITGLRERDKREKSEEKIDCHHQDSNQGPSLVASDALTTELWCSRHLSINNNNNNEGCVPPACVDSQEV